MKKKFRLDGSVRKGLSYGVVSGVVTTLGLLIGLIGSGASKNTAIAGVLTIAFADALSDSLGMHVSEESNKNSTNRQIWRATISTAVGKMVFGLSFVLPIVVMPITLAVIVDMVWGIIALSVISYVIAKNNKEKVSSVLIEHIGITIIVVIGSFLIGKLINIFMLS